ncbi:MAG TPA: DUF433 domain-containing protein [Acidimicrobiales bacterium]
MSGQLSQTERKSIAYALRHPRGRYAAERASQLSGVPKSTVYDWRRAKVYEPDFTAASPVMWSYRDLVLLRLLAWLRQGGMERPVAADKVQLVKAQLSAGVEVQYIHATATDVVLNGEHAEDVVDDRHNLLPFSDFFRLLNTFDLLEPIEELRSARRGPVWAPDLVTPSEHSFISPWVLAGDPCVERTRIPTSAIHALSVERALPAEAIAELYPGLTVEAANDAIELERRLRGLDISAAA